MSNSRNVLSLSHDGWDTFMVSRNIVYNLRSRYKLAQFRRVRATVWHDRCLQCLHNHRTCWCAIQCVLAMMCCAIPHLVHEMRSCISLCRSTTVHLRLSNPVTVKANQVSGRNILRCKSVLNLSRGEKIRIFLESWILTLVQVKLYDPISSHRSSIFDPRLTMRYALYDEKRVKIKILLPWWF